MKIIVLNLKQALRNMRRNGWQTLFSLLGLVMGIVCLSYSLNWLWNETHHDSFRPGYKNLYLLNLCFYEDSLFTLDQSPNFTTSLCWPMTQYVTSRLPKDATWSITTHLSGVKLTAEDGSILIPKSFCAVDSNFARIAGLKSIAGDAEEALSRPDRVVLSRSQAEEFFGSAEKALGALIYTSSENDCLRGEHTFTVGAVIEDAPGPSNLSTDMLIGDVAGAKKLADGESEWSRFQHGMLVYTPDSETLQETLLRVKGVPMMAGQNAASVKLKPLRLSHLGGKFDTRKLIYPLAFVGLSVLLLVSAFFNYMALLTTLFLGRLRQYALRVSMGAGFGQCALWLYSEVVVMLLLCGLCTGVAMEWVDQLADIPEAATGVYRTLAAVMLVFCLSMMAGALLPILRVRRLYKVRQGTGMQRMGGSWTPLLVQVAVCSLMLFVLATAYRQMHSIFTADLGFHTENILRVDFNADDPRLGAMKNHALDIEDRLRGGASPAIETALALNDDIFENHSICLLFGYNIGIEEEPYANQFVRMLQLPVEAYSFFGMEMKEGSWFEGAPQPRQTEIVVNPEMLDEFNLHDYATRELTVKSDPPTTVNVKGVLSFRTRSLHTVQESVVIMRETEERYRDNLREGGCQCIYVKHRPDMEDEARRTVLSTLEEYGVPVDLVGVERLSDYVNRNYDKERNYLRVFSAIAASSVVITLMGVLSMILYTLRLQRRGIAIRRVFGATYATLCRHYLRGYVIVTLVAAVVALPAGWHLSALWLEGYAVRIAIGWLQPVVIVGVLLGIIGAIVALQVRRAMREQPAEVIADY